MSILNDIPLPVEELTNETAAAISGGGSFGEGVLSLMPEVERMLSLKFPLGSGNETPWDGTEAKLPEESIQEISKKRELINKLVAHIEETY